MDKQTIALFDFDIIAYRSSAAVEKRVIDVEHKSSGRVKRFKTRTEFKKFLEKKNFDYVPEDYNIVDVQIPEPEENAFQVVKVQVHSIKQEIKADHLEGFVGVGDKNFRLDLELPILYKGQRAELMRPVHLKAAKEYALKKFPGGLIEGIEADDHLVIRSHELERAGHYPVIVSLDKDSKGCVGTRFYDWTQDNAKIIEIPPFGYIDYNNEKKKVDGIGLQFYCYQMLAGDTADNYRPNHLHGQRFGDVQAVNLLRDCSNVHQLFEAVETQYKEWFPDPLTYQTHNGITVTKNYKEILELYHQCVYMKRKQNDGTTFYSLWEEFR